MKKIALWAVIGTMQLMACSSKSADEVKPVPGGGTETPNTTGTIRQVDESVQSLMSTYNVPGVSVAITKNGKLVYAKAYGSADREGAVSVSTTSLFRIASLSKPVTAMAVMKLVEEGKLNLDSRVFGQGNILGTEFGTKPYPANIQNITVKNLLQHTSGAWQNDNSDPMFTNPDLTAQQLMTWTLDNRPLDNAPGTHYAYSNFGYSILGRIIEKASGKSYEDYVKTAILAPLGITTMQIGGNTLADRKPNEVKYYGQNGANPYIYNISRMDAHGGWIASATDLVKLLVHADGFASKADFLTGPSIQTMKTASTANPSYALGWMVNASDNWWHTGSLPGTYTMLARTSGGYTWSVLTNTRSPESSFGTAIDQLIWKAVNDQTTQWPDKDLF